MFHAKKKFTKSCLILYFSFILVTWSLLQISLTDFFENNDNILKQIPSIYAQDDDGWTGNGEVSYDNGDSGVEEQSLDKEDTQDEDVRQEDVPEELTLSEDSQDEYVKVSRFVGGSPSRTDINLQLPSGDPQPLLIGLPPLPGGPFPPGGLPPIPGSPLPPGSPTPPGGGPTPPEDLPSVEDIRSQLGDLPPHDGYHDDDDDENEEDDDKEKEDADEDNDDKDNN